LPIEYSKPIPHPVAFTGVGLFSTKEKLSAGNGLSNSNVNVARFPLAPLATAALTYKIFILTKIIVHQLIIFLQLFLYNQFQNDSIVSGFAFLNSATFNRVVSV
jgi:hypothetical protein